MELEIKLRKEAIRRHLLGETITGISRALGKNRRWVYYWIERYDPDHPEESLQDRSRAPQQPQHKWPQEVVQQALASRQLRLQATQPGYQYALVGAQAISYELQALGVSPTPPARTIHYWIQQAKLFPDRPDPSQRSSHPRPYPDLPRAEVNQLQQFDSKGPFFLPGSPLRYYLLALRDYASHRVALGVSQGRKAEAVVAFLIPAWQRLGIPQQLQMDNGPELRGSNRYPRSFGKVVHLCIELDIEVVFIPSYEPWRNGMIENFNGLTDRLLLKRGKLSDFPALQASVREFEEAVNDTHRLSFLNGQTPNEFSQTATIPYLPEGYEFKRSDLQLVKGKISFIRRVRKSGRITLFGNDKFEIDPELSGEYVLARADLQAQRLDIYRMDKLLKTFEYLVR